MIKLKNVLLTESFVKFTPEEKAVINQIKTNEISIDDVSQDLMMKFYEFFNEKIPYDIAKARTGDPNDWIMNHIDEIPMNESTSQFGYLLVNENTKKLYQCVGENKLFHIGTIGNFNGKPILSYIYNKAAAKIEEVNTNEYRKLNDYESILAEKAMINPAYRKYLDLAGKITGLRIRL